MLTKRLKEQVRRNLSRFPEDFMFELVFTYLDELLDKEENTKPRNTIGYKK